MARIKPGSLAGSVPLWTQMDIRGPARSRRRKKEPIRPEEILAWFNLAQTVAQDKSILGGLINAVSRGNREEAIATDRMRALEGARRVGPGAPGAEPQLPQLPFCIVPCMPAAAIHLSLVLQFHPTYALQ